jgi:hypothetical protein
MTGVLRGQPKSTTRQRDLCGFVTGMVVLAIVYGIWRLA